jgi:plastocyanin
MRYTKLFLALLVAAPLAAACNDDDTTAPVDNRVITAAGQTFSPATLILTPADSTAGTVGAPPAAEITWKFESGGPHNVVFEDGAPGSGQMSTGEFTRDVQLNAPMTIRYRCTNHSTDFTTGMVGTITVNLDD